MASTTGLVIVKRFTYRDDDQEEWSSKYWLTGPPPDSDQAWLDLFNLLGNEERKCYTPQCFITRYIGYNDNADGAHSVYNLDLAQIGAEKPGTLPTEAGHAQMAGDQAGMISWQTSRKNSRGKWVYLRKYLHAGHIGTDVDKVSTNTESAYNAFAQVLFTGTGLQGRTLRSQKQDEVLQFGAGSQWVTTRTLKRRGKRP